MHSCGVTRNIRKRYAIASFHPFGSSPQALTLKAAGSSTALILKNSRSPKSAGHQLAPLCDELRDQGAGQQALATRLIEAPHQTQFDGVVARAPRAATRP